MFQFKIIQKQLEHEAQSPHLRLSLDVSDFLKFDFVRYIEDRIAAYTLR